MEFSMVKKALIKVGIGVAASVILVMGIAGGLAGAIGSVRTSSDTGSVTYGGNTVVDMGNYEVSTDVNGALKEMSKDELTKAVNDCYTGELHDKLIEKLDTIISVQNSKKINAAFIVSNIAVEVNSGGNLEEITNDIDAWISDYIEDGKTKIDDISTKIGNEKWKDSIKDELDKFYAAAGVSIIDNASGEAIVAKAAEIMKYMMDNGYAYANGNMVPKERNGKVCDCSAFVCWVLYELGYTNAQNNGAQLNTYGMDTNGSGYFANNGWTKVNSYAELEPGDIVIMSGEGNPNGHVQIFAYRENGVNYFINCGWDPYRHNSVYETYCTTFYSAWRVPK